MQPAFAPDPVPVQSDPEGVLRVAGSRVTLDVLVTAFDLGQTPEEIVQQYPSLDLGTVYGALTYVLNHRNQIDVYLAGRRARAIDVKNENERRHAPDGLRQRLLNRRPAA